ncbi:MAG: ABC transporter ATP-binding protein [Nitrososphaerota archaeon]|nr:ABC transporter ATP-binding protein/permease [Candidatus Bathyarchaeota archaeon]MDW8049070.1 ABC transporter ATP-binding protein [Nitrososphaerota archaeon]
MGFHPHPPHHHEYIDIPLERKMSSREIISRLLGYLKPHRKLIFGVVIAVLITSVTGIVSPYILGREIVAKYILKGDISGLHMIILIFVGIQIINWAANTVRTYGLGKIGQSLLMRIRADLFSHLQTLSFSFFDKSDSGDLISRLTNDTDAIGEAFTSGLVQVASDILSLFMIIIVMFSLNVQLTLASLAVVPLIVAVAVLFNSRFRAAYRLQRMKISEVTSKLQESISGIREIKSFTKEKDATEDFKTASLENLQANLQAAKVWGSFFPTVQLLEAAGSGIVTLYGGWLAFNGMLGSIEDAVGTIITFIMYVRMFFGPIMDLTNFYNTVQSALAASERIFEILDIKPEIVDCEEPADLQQVRGQIEFRNVTFGYKPEHPVIHNLSFSVKPHEMVALVGPTGAGKSTIVKLLCRFYEPQSGSIMIDGHDLRKISLKSLRKHISIVPQETFLFSGTIMDNIRYGRIDATDEEVISAAKMVGANEFIERLPEGYNTKIGERGAGLSVGQKQLIAFARALLRNPSILILDEATSSIDPYTDLIIRRAMRLLFKDRTSIVIAHRLSTVRDADRILVIDDGRIVEEGTHRELIKRGGLYSHLYEMQFKEPEKTAIKVSSPIHLETGKRTDKS